jgi:threonine-phosphate decarboxylase
MKNPSAEEWPHRHGGNPIEDFKRLKIQPRSVVDFSININPFGPPTEVTNHWDGLAEEIVHYPSVDGEGIVQFYRKVFDLTEDCILPGNGSIEHIYLVPRALGFRRVAIPTPSFHDYERAARRTGAEVSSIPLAMDNDSFTLSLQVLNEQIAETDAVFVGNPNNPTGTLSHPEDFLELARRNPDKFFLIDEAFIQFIENFELITLMNRKKLRPNILVFHSLTKFYSMPGLRLGAVLGHPETIARLRAFKEPWTINAVAEKIAGILSGCGDFEKKTRHFISGERRRVFSRLKPMAGLKLFDTTANFFLAQWRATPDLDDLLRALLSKGLYMRDCRNFPGLEDNFFRFAIRKESENDRLIDAIARTTGE